MVEIVMGVEEQFGTEIPDEDVSEIATVGDFYEYLCYRMHDSTSRSCRNQKTFHRIRSTLMRTTDVPRWFVRPSTPLAEFLPIFPAKRKAVLRRLRHEFPFLSAFDPGETITVESMVRLAVRQEEARISVPPPDGWSSAAIWDALVEIISRQLEIPLEQIHYESHFVEDLDVG